MLLDSFENLVSAGFESLSQDVEGLQGNRKIRLDERENLFVRIDSISWLNVITKQYAGKIILCLELNELKELITDKRIHAALIKNIIISQMVLDFHILLP